VLSIQEIERQRAFANVPRSKPNQELYTNAALLELGVADPKNIQVKPVP
jgi:hypothetical protein